MQLLSPRTKIVATIGPASLAPPILKKMVLAGMGVARLNFSHGSYDDHAISEALNAIDEVLDLHCIVAFTGTGYSARLASKERLTAPVVALTPSVDVYHQLNLVWGVRPLLIDQEVETFEAVVQQVESCLLERQLAVKGDRILIMGGIPMRVLGGTNFLKIHTIGA